MIKNCLMVQGTSSDAGKSTVVAGLCRVLARKGASVAPFKPQNMALNSAVTGDGGEIGRAQALQALACNIEASTDMNPVLIKPSSDTGAQIIIQGQVLQDMDAKSFHSYKPLAQQAVLQSFERLAKDYGFIIVEGAGSPAEINLREGDIANMGFAEAVDCPVILVADIDRGGVFAQLVGTLELLAPTERDRVIGFVINKFRGDIALLQSGLDWLETRTGKPVFGVLPFLHDFYVDSEDGIDTRQALSESGSSASDKRLRVVVPVLPRISNHTDFDSLRLHPNVDLRFVSCTKTPPAADLVILPGSKNVRSDLDTLLKNNWDAYLKRHLRFGGKLMGICGGFQMLGLRIDDNLGIEGAAGSCSGFGLISMTTEFLKQKTLQKKSGILRLNGKDVPVAGYEIHHGQSYFSKSIASDIERVLVFTDGSRDGFVDASNQIFGSYLHGILDTPDALNSLLAWAGLENAQAEDLNALREQELNRLSDSIEQHLDLESLFGSALDYRYEKSASVPRTHYSDNLAGGAKPSS